MGNPLGFFQHTDIDAKFTWAYSLVMHKFALILIDLSGPSIFRKEVSTRKPL